METANWLKDRAVYFFEASAYEEAVPYLMRLLKLPGVNPYDLSFAHFMLGEIQLQNGRYRLAREHLRKSMEIAGEDALGLLLLGQAYCGDSKFTKAREALERARRYDPKNEAIELSLGVCMCMKGEFDEAIEVYERCLKINPERAEAYVGLAQSLAATGEIEKAREVLEAGRERIPLSLTIRLTYRELDKIEKVRQFCDWMIDENLSRLNENTLPMENTPMPIVRTLMVEYGFPPGAIKKAEKLWDDFVRVSLINPRKQESWAAAVVYAMGRITGTEKVKQSTLAIRLEISPSTISANFNAIAVNLKIKKHDPRYLD